MRKLALILLAFGCAVQAVAQTPTATTIVGPVFDSVGNAYSGSFTVQSQAKTNYGVAITGTVRTIYVNAGVIQSFTLIANDTSTPNLTSYSVTYANSDRWLCIVPTVASPVATTATTVATNATITVASGAGIVTGQLVSGVGIPANTTVLSVSGTSIGLSTAPTGSATVAITFYTTVGFAQICTPNATPPNVNTPLPPAQILPSAIDGYYLGTSGGVTRWMLGSGSVSSFIGRIGQVVAANGDYNTSQVTETGNLYFTTGRAQAAISISGLPLTYSGGVLGINMATNAQSGYLSAADWNKFNTGSNNLPLAPTATGVYCLGVPNTPPNSWLGAFTWAQITTSSWSALTSGNWAAMTSTSICGGGNQGPPGTPGINGSNGTPGTNGSNGNTILSGTGAPGSGTGSNGDFYLNTSATCLYGPKATGAWPGSCVLLVGTNGANGINGNTILNGTANPPGSGIGNNGDFYLNTAISCLWGPKAAGVWPGSCTSLIGQSGTAGSNGNTVLSGNGAPGSGTGNNGDFYINLLNSCLYGPKATGAWPGSCTSLIGATGPTGSLPSAVLYTTTQTMGTLDCVAAFKEFSGSGLSYIVVAPATALGTNTACQVVIQNDSQANTLTLDITTTAGLTVNNASPSANVTLAACSANSPCIRRTLTYNQTYNGWSLN